MDVCLVSNDVLFKGLFQATFGWHFFYLSAKPSPIIDNETKWVLPDAAFQSERMELLPPVALTYLKPLMHITVHVSAFLARALKRNDSWPASH